METQNKKHESRPKRRSKYIRPTTKKDIPSIVLGPRDLEIIRTVYDFRFLRTDHVTKLIKGDRTSIEKRLKLLWLNRYLDRIFLPWWPCRPRPSTKAIYVLDRQGARFLAESSGIDSEKLHRIFRQKRIGERYFYHSLMISNFMTILTLALRNRKDLDLLFWRQDNEIQDRANIVIARDKHGRKVTRSWPVVPDAFFGINIPKKGKSYFMLECDRSTMSHRRFLNKMRAYWNWWKQGIPSKKFGIKNFRVLTLTLTPERARNLRMITRWADDRHKGSHMFWFATEKDLLLEDPKTVFKNIWLTASDKDRVLHSLLE